jgi:hypothetical protein
MIDWRSDFFAARFGEQKREWRGGFMTLFFYMFMLYAVSLSVRLYAASSRTTKGIKKGGAKHPSDDGHENADTMMFNLDRPFLFSHLCRSA